MERKAKVSRKTLETDITLALNLDGGDITADTGIGFFDHMLRSMAFHAGWGLSGTVRGDLEVDGHHTVEDTGIALGQALQKALGDKRGIARFGEAHIPMDEALAFAALDISGRPYCSYQCEQGEGTTGEYDPALTREFFRALCVNARLTLHLKATGENAHHITEALFKATGRALRAACAVDGDAIPSSKGVL